MRTQFCHDGTVNSGMIGVRLLPDNAVLLPNGNEISVVSSCYQSLLCRSVSGVVYDRLYYAYGGDTVRLVGDEIPLTMGQHDLYMLDYSAKLYREVRDITHLNILSGKKEVISRAFIPITPYGVDNSVDPTATVEVDAEDFTHVGSTDTDGPPVIVRQWGVWGKNVEYRIEEREMTADLTVAYLTRSTKRTGDGLYTSGYEDFTIRDGRVQRIDGKKRFPRMNETTEVSFLVTVSADGKEYQYYIS